MNEKEEINPANVEDDTSTVIMSSEKIAEAAAAAQEQAESQKKSSNPMTETSPIPNDGSLVLPERRQLKISCPNCMQKLDVTYLDPFIHINCPICHSDLIVPKWFDSYLLEEEGGVGGMATVYRALDIALDREVAIKVLKPEVANDASRAELFLHEARTAATINHYAVVPIYTCGIYESQTYIIMQYMAGGSLENKLKLARGILPVHDVAVWIRDIAEGLENARMHGIVHHDIKPGNIMLDNEGNAKIGDFGIAQVVNNGRATNDDLQKISRSWVSPHYVSPEKVRTEQEGFQGDIYSLGATFYHLATGVTPFNHSDIEELIRMRLTTDPLQPNVQRPEVGAFLSELIMRMMNRNPAKRPDYKMIIADLNAYLREEAEKQQAAKVQPQNSGGTTSRRRKSAAVSAASRRYSKRSHLIEILVMVCLLVIFGGGAYYLWSHGVIDRLLGIENNGQDLNLNPEISQTFAAGNPKAAGVYSSMILADPASSVDRKMEAALENVFASFLQRDPDAKSKAKHLLTSLTSVAEQAENGKIYADSLAVLSYLANGEEDFSGMTAEKVKPAITALAVLMQKAYQDTEEKENLEPLFQKFKIALPSLDSQHWVYASWSKRIPYWDQAICQHSGHSEETEPLFRGRITQEADWTFLPKTISPDDLNALFDSNQTEDVQKEKTETGPDKTPGMDSAAPIVTEELIRNNVESYIAAGRPVPQYPASLRQLELKPYLDSLPKEKQRAEKIRLNLMRQTVSYIARMGARNAYRVNSFQYEEQNLGKGEAMFNERYLLYRQDGISKRLEWDLLPYTEVMNILLYYTTYRENAVQAAERVYGDMRGELAMAYLRYALVCSWYRNYDQAAKYAQKAMTLLPAPKTWQAVRILFLD